MTSKAREILLVSAEARTVNDVVRALEGHDHLRPSAVCRDIASLPVRLQNATVPVVIVDIDPAPMAILDHVEPLANGFPATRFVALTSELSSEVIMRAMQVGVRHLQVKAALHKELPGVLDRLAINGHGDFKSSGAAVTVLSASGGCGATTLVVNLANELQLKAARKSLIVDLDYNYGAVASYLDLQGFYGIAEVLAHPGGIDAQLVRSTAVIHSDRLHALISPASVDLAAVKPPDPEKMAVALTACKQAYGFTVVDAPRLSFECSVALAGVSELTIVVLQPMVKDIRAAHSLMQLLNDRGIPLDHIMPVVNRYRRRHQMIHFEDAQKVLGASLGRLSNDYASAVKSINYGKPLAFAAPRSALRRDVASLAGRIESLNGKMNGKVPS